jgi:hypothetical protein
MNVPMLKALHEKKAGQVAQSPILNTTIKFERLAKRGYLSAEEHYALVLHLLMNRCIRDPQVH